MKEKILFVVTSHGKLGDTDQPTGYFLSEVTHPWDVLADEYDIDVTSPLGGKPPVTGVDLSDPVNGKFWSDPRWQEKMAHTMKPAEVKPDDYAAVFYAGGHGVMWDFPDNAALAAIGSRIYENGGVVAAVCHGPAGLLNIRLRNGDLLVSGKSLDCFTNAEEVANGTASVVPFMLQTALEERGCIFDCGGLWSDHVVVDGRLVTGQNPMSATHVGRELKKVLAGQRKGE